METPNSNVVIDHQEMVMVLSKSPRVIREELTELDVSLIHHAIGFSGEVAEMLEGSIEDVENVQEEIGDALFYLTGLVQDCPITQYQYKQADTLLDARSVLVELSITAGKILDQVKRLVIYRKQIELSDLEDLVHEAESLLDAYAALADLTLEDCLKANIDKLANKRYPNGYSDQAAIARADKVA